MLTFVAATTLRRAAAVTTAAVLGLTLAPPAQAAGADPAPTPIQPAALDRKLQNIVDAGGFGVTAEVSTRGATWAGAAGRAQRDPSRPASPDARFRAASVTKMTTAVLALQLVERGRWDLDTTTVGDVLPGLWPERSGVTLRQLLSHTSGIPEMLTPLLATAVTTPEFVAAISRRRTDRELVEAARTQPLTIEPGAAMSYSNTNFVIVGMMLRRATGRQLPALLRERVLKPAGMTESAFGTRRAMAGPRLKEYGVLYGKVEDLSSFHPSIFSAAGALTTTARDLNRFQLALSTGDLVAKPFVRRMRSLVAVDDTIGLEYGLGSYRVQDPCRKGGYLYGHDGGSFGAFTLSLSTPGGQKRVTAAMTGRNYDGDLKSAVALNRFVYQAFAQTCGGGLGSGGGVVPGATREPAGLDARVVQRVSDPRLTAAGGR